MPSIDEVAMQFEPVHRGHVDVGDQTGCFGALRGSEKSGCRWEIIDPIAQRPHEPSHGLAKRPVIIDDRDQELVGQISSGVLLERTVRFLTVQWAQQA